MKCWLTSFNPDLFPCVNMHYWWFVTFLLWVNHLCITKLLQVILFRYTVLRHPASFSTDRVNVRRGIIMFMHDTPGGLRNLNKTHMLIDWKIVSQINQQKSETYEIPFLRILAINVWKTCVCKGQETRMSKDTHPAIFVHKCLNWRKMSELANQRNGLKSDRNILYWKFSSISMHIDCF